MTAAPRAAPDRGVRSFGAIPRDEAERSVRAHLQAVQRVAEFAFFERVLSLWHAVHVPLCVLLFLAGSVHVVAVHLY